MFNPETSGFRNLALAVAIGIGTAGTAGCHGTDAEVQPVAASTTMASETEPTYEKLSEEYEHKLGVDLDEDSDYLAATGMEPSELQQDLGSRSQTLPLSNQASISSAYSHGTFRAKSADRAYLAPNSRSTGYAAWVINQPTEDFLSRNFLPIATVQKDDNNRLVVTDQRPPLERKDDVSNTNYKDLVDKVIKPAGGLISLAMQTNALDSVKLVYDDKSVELEDEYGAESSFYNTDLDDAVVVLPKTKPVTYEEIRTTITHETGHALFSTTLVSEISPEAELTDLAAKLRDACSELRATTFEETANNFRTLIPIYKKLQKLVPERSKEIEYIIKQIKNSGYGAVQPKTGEPEFTNNDYPECFVLNANAMIGYTHAKILKSDVPGKKLSDEAIKVVGDLKSTFSKIYRSSSVMKAVSEHGYVDDKDYGHPEDGLDELAVSLFNIAVNFPDEFRAKLRHLSPDAAKAIQHTYNAVRAAYVASHPQLHSLIPILITNQ